VRAIAAGVLDRVLDRATTIHFDAIDGGWDEPPFAVGLDDHQRFPEMPWPWLV
jgi:hypothetical protein